MQNFCGPFEPETTSSVHLASVAQQLTEQFSKATDRHTARARDELKQSCSLFVGDLAYELPEPLDLFGALRVVLEDRIPLPIENVDFGNAA